MKKSHSTASKVASVVSIPGYEIKDLLGRGGMAMVYLAVQKSIDREVALKVLSPDFTDDSFSERFLREAKIASHLAHPNIITIFDAGIHNDIHYMSMEYIKGKNFNDARDMLSRKQKIIIIKEIALALEFASKKGFVHRDIKPENILLHQDGRAILTDFGIAKTTDVSQGLTETGKILGTPYFMSPEQTKGLKIDYRTDIYSLGVVLFQALTGYVPYDGPSLVSICIKHLSDPIPQLPKGLELFQPIINTCMSKKPEHRYQNASELYDALDKISDTQLAQIDAEANAFKHSVRTANAQTMVESSESVIQNNSADKVKKTTVNKPATQRNTQSHGYIKTKQSNFITQSEDYKKLKRRKRYILFFVLILILAVGYIKKEVLIDSWFTIIAPLAQKHLTDDITKHLFPEKNVIKKTSIQTTAQIKTPLDIENEKIQALIKTFDKIPSNAAKLAKIYSDRILITPDDKALLSNIQSLKDWYFSRISNLSTAKDYITANKEMAIMLTLFPKLDQDEKYNLVLNQLEIDQKNEVFLQKSRVYFAVNALNTPSGANALEQLKIVQHNDPMNKEAIAGITKIANHFKSKAQTEYNKQQYFHALDSVNAALQAISDDTELLALQASIKTAINNSQDINVTLNNAKKLISQGYSIKSNSNGDSAYDFYQQILRKDKSNKLAVNGLNRIHNHIVKSAIFSIKQNQFQESTKLLSKALTLFPNSTELKQLKIKLQAEMDTVLPIVPHIKISSSPIREINQTKLQKIKVGQLLYVGFEYNNFTQERTLLFVKVYNGNKQNLILEKQLNIIGKTGIHYFTLQLPKIGITSGDYSIELLLGQSRLIKANLFGIH